MRWALALILIAHGCDGAPAVDVAARAGPSTSAGRPPSPTAVGPARFTVATYNVNAGMAGDRAILAALRQLDADMVFLQEATVEWERSVRRELGRVYPYIVFRPYRDSFGGLAILSRIPVGRGVLLRPDEGPFPAWLTRVETALGPLQILNVHLFPPVRWRERGWMRAYADSQELHVRELAGFLPALEPWMPTLIVGDLNEAAAGKAVRQLIAQGFTGAVDPSTPTWRWQTDLGVLSWQLDHILYRGPLTLVAARVVNAGNSDHLPAVATFARRAGKGSPR